MKLRKYTVVALLMLFGASACADLDVTNPNAPDREQALASPGDIQSLVTSSFQQWWLGQYTYGAAGLFMSNVAFQHVSMAANSCMYNCASLPRPPIQNQPVDGYYANMTGPWDQSYKALAAIADGLRSIENTPEVQEAFDEDELILTRTFARFVQGLAHASVAVLYDKGYQVDEEVVVFDETGQWTPLGEPLPYMQLMDVAIGYLDEALALAEANVGNTDNVFRNEWLGTPSDLTYAELIPVINTVKASYMSRVARTPEERAALDWPAIMAVAQQGLYTPGEAWLQDEGFTGTNWAAYNMFAYAAFSGTWGQATYWIMGMADQSGNYQDWLSVPVPLRRPEMDVDGDGTEESIYIVTPDLRFPQGETLAEQAADEVGSYRYAYLGAAGWSNAGRGTWRWSYYQDYTPIFRWLEILPSPYYTARDMRLLVAEGHLRAGNTDAAAAIIDETRVPMGLDAASDGVNDSCVPKLPDGSCGDMMEMLKWEKRMETAWNGQNGVGTWYFDGRGWGDLYKGTFLQFPMPAQEAELLGLEDPMQTHGGGRGLSSDGSVYGWPSEG